LLTGKPQEEPKKKTGPFPFSINNIQIVAGKVEFSDGPRGTVHRAEEIQIGIPFVSTMPDRTDTFVKPSFAARINGTSYTLEGQSKPFQSGRETDLDIVIGDLNLPYYLPYLPLKLNGRLLSAKLDAKMRLAFRQEKEGTPSLTLTGNVTLKEVAFDDLQGKPLLRLPSLSVDLASVRPLAGEVHLARLALEAPEISVRRNEKGEINLLTLLPKAQPPSPPATPPAKVSAPEEKGEKTVVEIDELLVEKGKVLFTDAVPHDPFQLLLSDIRLAGSGLSTAAGREGKASLSFSLPKKGSFSLEGPVTIAPLATKLALTLKDLDLSAFQPYLGEAVQLRITGGKLSTDGTLLVDSAGGPLKTRYTGKLLVTRFASVDTAQANDLLNWETLHVKGIDMGTEPLFVHIREIALSRFYSRVLIREDGTLNLQNLAVAKKEASAPSAAAGVAEQEKSAPSSKEKQAGRDIRMDAITLQGGEIDFTDRFIDPDFSGKFVELGGRVSGLSSLETSEAAVELRGKLDGYAPLEITGAINPLRKDLFVNLKASFKDMDLSPVTPYSGKYIGYTIRKGKLSFDLRYLINRKKLESQNNFFIDQFTLGDRVESPQATKLPVSLAISLLKDRNDQIKLDIPVSGSLDDPEFSVWRIVVQVLVNLLTKAATAPFALLGSLFGGGEELSFVEFATGSAVPAERELKKIQPLAKALKERPALKLDIAGYVDIEKDREALKGNFFQRKLKVQKLNEESRKGKEAVALDAVVITPDEYEKFLKMAYDAEKFPKPRDTAGQPKSLPVPEMEKLILTYTEVKDDDLRLLAAQRALNVRDALLQSGEVTPERIFMIEPSSLSPPKKEPLQESRVDFRLK
ncbi:MAG: DUF748 domain-containing protein, partial [Deltaproteobacteria bacterium]|nr:DUF748 domain-containing protein [Deltaproteobacteria bacterium]